MYLGQRDLDPADLKLLQVFLRFAGRGERHQWTLATSDAEHLVLRAPQDEGTVPMPLDAASPEHTAWILAPGQQPPTPGSAVLHRPLQIEAFAAVLRAREAQIERGEMPAPAATPAAPVPRPAPVAAVARPAPVPAPAPRPVPVVPPAPTASGEATAAVREPALAVAAAAPATAPTPAPAPAPVHAPAVAAKAASPVVPARPLALDPRAAYRLLKWPGSELLRGRPKFVRLLGFISHKALSVERLIVLSGVDEASCLEMLGLLDERRLLQRLDFVPSPVVAPVVRAVAATGEGEFLQSAITDFADTVIDRTPVPPPAGGPQRGLFQRLRLRLGI